VCDTRAEGTKNAFVENQSSAPSSVGTLQRLGSSMYLKRKISTSES
jgi:hypothetical protein